ncbi:MAG: hypothetical protein KJ674_02470 [Nanoarchaeota archaeon]|nr:hypothetical protein [Nanoarchaeota archaeon]
MTFFKDKKKAVMDLPKPEMSLQLPRFPEPDFSEIRDIKPNLPKLKPLRDFRPMEDLEAESRQDIISNKPLFVRIEKYHEAMNDLKKIREKLREAEKVLENVMEIKKEEDKELNMWHEDIIELKDKMNRIDHVLFEMKT